MWSVGHDGVKQHPPCKRPRIVAGSLLKPTQESKRKAPRLVFHLVGGSSCQAVAKACLICPWSASGWNLLSLNREAAWMALAPTLMYATS